jgi:3-oxoacyl-[acyl-carrier protein] reductase
MIDTGLNGKVALVTGANHGIGAATAQAFAAQGAAVFITYLRLPPGENATPSSRDGASLLPGPAFYQATLRQSAAETVRAIQASGGRAASWEVDLGVPGSVVELVDRVEQTVGPVDVLVNNAAHAVPDSFIPAGGSHTAPLAPGGRTSAWISAASHDQHFAVNSRGPALLMAEYVARFLRRGATWGRIVNVSTDGSSGFVGEISYGASKHAMESYSRAAASELAPLGITVNVVSPAAVQTGWLSPESEEAEAGLIPMGRVGEPSEVADVIVFFASQQARWITGQLLYVGGGHMMPL